MLIDAANLNYKELNDAIRHAGGDCRVRGCLGQRFLGAGMRGISICVEGIPGNALGAYLDGASITVLSNAQDAVGDTMNDGKIVVHGSIGDAAGYAMRGGRLYVRGNAGYRAGIHMKEYENKTPVMIIGGSAGSFLGEYQAGGKIVVLGLSGGEPIVGEFPCTGMHGGKIFLRGKAEGVVFPRQVTFRAAEKEDMEEIRQDLAEFASLFGLDFDSLFHSFFTVVTPDSRNPYKRMYVEN